jgi:DNA-directed RNA polymerase specialized sigma24 family protein
MRILRRLLWLWRVAVRASEARKIMGVSQSVLSELIRDGLVHAEKSEAGVWEIDEADVRRLAEKYQQDKRWRHKEAMETNWRQYREEILNLRGKGYTVPEIARLLDKDQRAVYKMLERLRKAGLLGAGA